MQLDRSISVNTRALGLSLIYFDGMKYVIAFLCWMAGWGASVLAQDWHPLPGGDTYLYKAGPSDVPEVGVRMDSALFTSTSITHYLNPVNLKVPYSVVCDGEPALLINQPGPLGFRIEDHPDHWLCIGPDSLLLPKTLPTDGVWLYNATEQAQLVSVYTLPLFGLNITVREVELEDWGTLLWSQHYGIVEIPMWNAEGQWELVGIQHADLGITVPDAHAIFDWEVGDVFYYLAYSYHSDNPQMRRIRRKVLERIDEAESVYYVIQEHRYKAPFSSDWGLIPAQLDSLIYDESFSNEDWGLCRGLPGELIGEGKMPYNVHLYEEWYYGIAGFTSIPEQATPVQLALIDTLLTLGSYCEVDEPSFGYFSLYDESRLQDPVEDLVCYQDWFSGPNVPLLLGEGLGVLYMGYGQGLTDNAYRLIAWDTHHSSFGDINALDEWEAEVSIADYALAQPKCWWDPERQRVCIQPSFPNAQFSAQLYSPTGQRIPSNFESFGNHWESEVSAPNTLVLIAGEIEGVPFRTRLAMW